MTRGGARLNAGAKPKWKHGKTKTIRIPESLIPQVLEFVQKLDAEKSLQPQSNLSKQNLIDDNSINNESLNLSGISIHRIRGKSFVFIEDLIKLGYNIRPSKLFNTVLNESRIYDAKTQ